MGPWLIPVVSLVSGLASIGFILVSVLSDDPEQLSNDPEQLSDDPEQWYGEMICNRCGYDWQARRSTPPARCPKCSSKDVDPITG